MSHPLKDYTSRNLVVCHWLQSLEDAYDLLTRHRVRHLPVVDDERRIIGVISDRDFQRAMHAENDFVDLNVKPDFPAEAEVCDYMSWPVQIIEEDESVDAAAQIMVDKKISALLVTRKTEVIGIVTSEDLLRSLIDESRGKSNGIANEVRGVLYNSPIGQIAYTLANIGV